MEIILVEILCKRLLTRHCFVTEGIDTVLLREPPGLPACALIRQVRWGEVPDERDGPLEKVHDDWMEDDAGGGLSPERARDGLITVSPASSSGETGLLAGDRKQSPAPLIDPTWSSDWPKTDELRKLLYN